MRAGLWNFVLRGAVDCCTLLSREYLYINKCDLKLPQRCRCIFFLRRSAVSAGKYSGTRLKQPGRNGKLSSAENLYSFEGVDSQSHNLQVGSTCIKSSQPVTEKHLNSSVVWVITPREVASNRRFGTTCRSHF